MRLFMLAGEPSGDKIGGAILSELMNQTDAEVIGVGGPNMLDAGLEPHFDIEALQVMGFSDVIRQLPRLLRLVAETAEFILSANFDAVVLVDFKEFSTLLAKRLKKDGYTGPVILVVAPSVWAWRPGRAPKLRGVFDEILAVFPFEPRIMAQLGGPTTTYIGHPAAAALAPQQISPDHGHLVILPGSRRGELRRHLSVFERVVRHVHTRPEITSVVLPTLPRLHDMVAQAVAHWRVPVTVVSDPAQIEDAYANARAALASSGTVTLELALRGIPFVGTYVPDTLQAISYLVAGRPRILLPNVIAGRTIVPEELWGVRMTGRIVSALSALIADGPNRSAQRESFAEIRRVMSEGEGGAKKEDAAHRILSHLKP